MLKLTALFPIHSTNRGISGVFFSVCKEWQGPELKARMVVPSCDRECRGPNVVEAIPSFLTKLYYRSPSLPIIKTEKRFLKDIKDFDVAYLWPGLSLDTIKNVHKHSKPIFWERVNSCTSEAKRVLDDAYSRLGLEPQHNITPESIQDEKEKLKVVDFLFCPSPTVAKSFQEAGVPEEKTACNDRRLVASAFPPIINPRRRRMRELMSFS